MFTIKLLATITVTWTSSTPQKFKRCMQYSNAFYHITLTAYRGRCIRIPTSPFVICYDLAWLHHQEIHTIFLVYLKSNKTKYTLLTHLLILYVCITHKKRFSANWANVVIQYLLVFCFSFATSPISWGSVIGYQCR